MKMKNKTIQFKSGLLFAIMAVLAFSCTNLDLIVDDSLVAESSGGGFTGVEDPESSLTSLYNQFGNNYASNQERIYALSEVTSDEMIVPTRGTDWGDNGIWRTLHTHEWDAGHTFILQVWNDWNSLAYSASQVIDSRSKGTAQQVAEAKIIRAFSMWYVLDNFGVVPFREVDEGPEINPKILSNTEAFNYILDDIDTALPDLPNVGPGSSTNRMSKATAYFLKARVLLNAEVYGASADWAGVISAVDAVTNEGFSLVPQGKYFEMFSGVNSNERILFVANNDGSRKWSALHYSQGHPDNTSGGWNGFTTLSAFFDSFEGPPNSNYLGEGQEERRGWVPDANTANSINNGFGYGFLIGQQYNAAGQALDARGGRKLNFTRELPGLLGNNDITGIRPQKYTPANGAFVDNSIIACRYADAYLMKAEAMMRSGGDATAMVNNLRATRGASLLGSVTEDDMLAERGRELYGECVRRTDLVRFGKFSATWEFKDDTEEYKNVFPIPTNAILSNPNLVQNPGY
tara:strand:- start:9814 stop:11364 length:1551 start_codon:yes stop_codon:yes gene_type:complete